jgi:hypothetical protein
MGYLTILFHIHKLFDIIYLDAGVNERMRKEVAYFKVLFQNLPGGTEENLSS